MKDTQNKTHRLIGLASIIAGLCGAQSTALAAAPATPQSLITGKAFLGIAGTTIANLTNSAKFPNSPDVVSYLPYFEWAATGDIATAPGNYADNYGTQIVGFFYPPSTGNYTFYLCADDNAELYLSTDADPANKKLIARESVWSNPRQYLESGGASDLTMKDSSQYAATAWPTKDAVLGGATITLQAGRPYYIEALAKEGGGGDNLSVAVADPAGQVDSTSPIPGTLLSSDRSNGPTSIATQPLSQTIGERGAVTFSALGDGTPPHTFQWKKNGVDIPDATGVTYSIASVAVADNGAKYSVVVTGAQGTATSQDAVLTVTPDTALPTVLSAKGQPNLTEIILTFSEALDPASAGATASYQVSSAGGSLNITAAALAAGGTQVTLTAARMTLGTKYTVLISNLKDTAAAPNTIAANSKAVFFPTGKVVQNTAGFIVFETENYDRNLDGLWIANTTRGTPSGGASVVAPNGAGGNESGTQLEYDVEFKQAGTYQVWYRAGGADGADDSGWLWLDGARPVERDPASGADANSASMTGFSGQANFAWYSDSQGGPDPYTIDILTPGPHVIALARREDGSFFDKFVIAPSPTPAPTGFGPPETRQGAPGLPTVFLIAPAADQVFATGSNITLSANAAGQSGLEITRVDYTANGIAVGTATTSPFSFTWNGVAAGIYSIRATAVDEIGQSTTSSGVVITVGTPPPQALLVIGTASINPSDTGIKARLESLGFQVSVVQAPASTTSNGDGKQLIVVSSTVASGDVADKFRSSSAPVLMWEQAVQDNFLMTLDTAADHATLAGQTAINIVKADHPLAAGLSTGVKTMTTAAQEYSWGVPNANAVIIATTTADPTQAVIYGYEKGAMLIDGTTPAPARRTLFFMGNDSYAALTDDGKKLFDSAVQWTSGIQPAGPKTSARIAWVSFHRADATPSAAAAAAGFTKAPDVAYTDLLKENGHDVTRVLTSGTPDAALLNAFDLIIISRSVGSGDYQDPPETVAWNGITAPTMILGGYVLRSSRLGFVTGTTIPDTTGPVKLTVNNRTHAIFSGITLDAAGLMVNPYADVVTFNSGVQRGISVNTDPVAGTGAVLANIGTDSDPAFGGTVIAEWPAGATLGNAAADTLGGHRLVFLTGSREQVITAEGAGIFDLNADGSKLFLNAVNYMAGTVPGAPTPTLSFARTQTGLSITFTGTLQSANAVTGPWADEAATSPRPVTASEAQKFYRARR